MISAPTPSYGGPGGQAPLPNFSRYKAGVKLSPGEVLHYKPGQGYYSGPPLRTVTPRVSRTAPTPPVDPYGALTPAQVDGRATTIAQGELLPQQQAIQLQQQKADAAATAQRAEIEQFQLGAAKLLGDSAATVGAGYDAAAGQVGDLAGAVGGQVKTDLQNAQAQDQSFAAAQGQSGGSTIDPNSVGTSLGMINGVVPGTQLAAEGAAEQARAAEAAQLPIDAGNQEIAKAMADARAQDDQYAQQLLQIAQQYPGMKAQALQQLNQYELDKANYRRQLMDDKAANKVNQQQANTQTAAEKANAKAAGVDAAYKKSESAYKWASLQFQTQKMMNAAQAAAQKGKTIDVGASRLVGHIVYKDGSEDPSIKVRQSTASTPQQKAVVNRSKSVQKARTDGFKEASRIAGKPTSVPAKTAAAAKATGHQVGQYVADPSQKYGVPGGVFPPAYPGAPATTNNPARAQRTGALAGNYAAAQQMVYGAIGGDSLMSRYNLSRAQVMQIVNAALAQAGWHQ